MKKNDIIELNGEEYTVELNRQSYLAIDKYSNLQKTGKMIATNLYEYLDEVEISEDEDPFSKAPSVEENIEMVDQKLLLFKKLYTRAFWVWLYPNHKLSIEQVKELLSSYFDNDDTGEKFEYLSNKFSEFMEGSIKIRNDAEQEAKNLRAQANK